MIRVRFANTGESGGHFEAPVWGESGGHFGAPVTK